MHKWARILRAYGFFIILAITCIITKVIQSYRHDDALKKSIVVNGKITGLDRIKAGEVMMVNLPFNGHMMSSRCLTSFNDSLAIGDSVRLRVSINDPTYYIEYISRVNNN